MKRFPRTVVDRLDASRYVPKLRRLVPVALACILLTTGLVTAASAGADPYKRQKYDHVVRITADLMFDNHPISIDHLVDCRTDYTGPAVRAVQLPLRIIQNRIARRTADGGMISIEIPPEICSTYPEIWAGTAASFPMPEAWTPMISWFNDRDHRKATKGEVYFSEMALKWPSGRMQVLGGFKVTLPEETPELLRSLEKQATEHDYWLGDRPRVRYAGLGLKRLPQYQKFSKAEWTNPSSLAQSFATTEDFDALRAFLQAKTREDKLIYIGDEVFRGGNDQAAKAMSAIMAYSEVHLNVIGYKGIPQRSEHLWGMLWNNAAWQRVRRDPRQRLFPKGHYPVELVDGRLVLRSDREGMLFENSGYGDWYRSTEDRLLEFHDNRLVDGQFGTSNSVLVFDLETRDLWVLR